MTLMETSGEWRALVLAAGFGKRLLPYTRLTPKPLFTIDNRPLLEIVLTRLADAGCRGAIVNTHHLHEKIESFLWRQGYPMPVQTRYEPEILGTGGAIANCADFLNSGPFLVINSDIYTDIDPADVLRFHHGHDAPVTLVLHDFPRFNRVWVDEKDRITGFGENRKAEAAGIRQLAFTGIHVIDPRIFEFLPPAGAFSNIIEVYDRMISEGVPLQAMTVSGHTWHDIGTPGDYRQTAFERTVETAQIRAFGKATPVRLQEIAPDGSDARWARLVSDSGSLVACDRGIRAVEGTGETQAYEAIGRHFYDKGVHVPKIHNADPFAGLVVMEDLGPTSLQDLVLRAHTEESTVGLYLPVIRNLITLAVKGAQGFDPAWTCQTPEYDKTLVLEKECRYFTQAFVSGYLGLEGFYKRLYDEFEIVVDKTLTFGFKLIIHRDMQSRNIMIKDKNPFFIDFQGARIGPVQYDLASLLIDPYVALPQPVQERLVHEYMDRFEEYQAFDPANFLKGYACCKVTRNLQMLGAFGFLTQKGKKQFARYIPTAAASLPGHVEEMEQAIDKPFPKLKALARDIAERIRANGQNSS
ncbi:sugar phosphate nucleotidyltransferase [Desulfosudis oleivorans]|uniref:Aminoglycoside phosphotransferase n=1 Tax=Desulfosudis oleivorans (strain DSM 6200 / JCM 39069 / Hxd3) TaxID=96561 RepID=A8ZTB3_DESOH|nr:sugar phosphate nucleotidyltransferase [Desulfosudis oleivorans]ABW67796.1 aminoglycoside phosphotransferase [Desulfosudis oleivorans Hxd3]